MAGRSGHVTFDFHSDKQISAGNPHKDTTHTKEMSRLYDAAEPGVIDEDLLHTLVIEQGPQKEAGRIAISEGIDFSEVLQLRLDFKSMSTFMCLIT